MAWDISSKTDNRSMALGFAVDPGGGGGQDWGEWHCHCLSSHSRPAGDVTMGCVSGTSDRLCGLLFLPFISNVGAQRDLILEAILSKIPFPLTWAQPAHHQVLGRHLACGPCPKQLVLRLKCPAFHRASQARGPRECALRPERGAARLDLRGREEIRRPGGLSQR